MSIDDDVDPIIKQFAALYGMKILFGALQRPLWLGSLDEDALWETILAGLEARVKAKKAEENNSGPTP